MPRAFDDKARSETVPQKTRTERPKRILIEESEDGAGAPVSVKIIWETDTDGRESAYSEWVPDAEINDRWSGLKAQLLALIEVAEER